MPAPILWAPGKIAFFLQENPMSIKFLVLGGGGYFGFWGGGGCRFYFYGRGDFSDLRPSDDNVSRDMGYRSDSLASSRDMGPQHP